MNEYWDTSTDAELIAGRLETIADLLKKLIKVGEELANKSSGSGCSFASSGISSDMVCKNRKWKSFLK